MESTHREAGTVTPSALDHYVQERTQYWEDYAGSFGKWEPMRRYYRQRLIEYYRFLIPPGMRVLELGCGHGDLLAALKPAYGVGIDLSPTMIGRARQKYPQLHFEVADAHTVSLHETFDYIVCSDLINDLWDVQQVFENLPALCKPSTRVILNAYSRLWEIPRRIAEFFRLAKPLLSQNWLTAGDIGSLLYLADFEVVRTSTEIIWPVRTPGLNTFFNRYLAKLWPFGYLAITNFLVARLNPQPKPDGQRVSVVVPARNEAGNIRQILDRVPEMGAGTELIFVEGHSSDGTFERIQDEMRSHPREGVKLFQQTGKGKGDAVRLGFAHATGDVLMILDADLTVPPEDLPRFYEAWRSGKAEFVNGVRLVYPMEDKAMRFFNLAGNKFFSLAFSWLLSQTIKDTLCGTKVLGREQYDVIAANRSYFGGLDPFGDFDLIFGAAKSNLKMLDLPIRYRERKYGETNIQRWKHGWLLIRMVVLAMKRIKFV
ncbi:MAG: bifunctional class I SAM-dependent methyltransferase/glycosyltransferase family 2 protein [Acidobacteriota bacterium]|nr:bifunctional class I SAM-dependent methyltransferase/glycosyltransferase family 2 protein [Acidobacteriota bacterium]